ncbi:HD-GYP domain-containing protein [Eubacteriales bacterium OttesenSCG-928-N14]|nr:HD-GYP domain-containing protein [Eubacteriales bacterium OttesenSCG-928-N14]
MRYIPASCLREGQMLATDLVMDRRRVILRRGVPLSRSIINRIIKLGFQGVYIDDDLSKDLIVANIISDELKDKAKHEVKTLFAAAQKKSDRTVIQMDSIRDVVANIVDEILYNRNVIVNIVDLRTFDDYTFSHCINVALLSTVVGMAMGMMRDDLNELAMGALIHDIGKVFIDKDLINKAEVLTPEEYDELRRHSQYGYDYIASNHNIPDAAKEVVLTHHEKYDGSGYPLKQKGDEISLFSRIVCVADIYDALTSDRPYRNAMLPSDVMEYMMSGYNTMFDPAVVDAFTRRVAAYPIGTLITLSTGQSAIVVENFEDAGSRPKVRLIENGESTDKFIDLAHDADALNITISGIELM